MILLQGFYLLIGWGAIISRPGRWLQEGEMIAETRDPEDLDRQK